MDATSYGFGPALLWLFAATATAGALALSIIAVRIQNRWLIGAAATALVLAVTVLATPHSRPPQLVSTCFALAALALSAIGGSPAVRAVMALATHGRDREGPGGSLVLPGTAAEPGTRELLRGGATIGVLERLATSATILVGHPEALAVIVAIKGVGRFTELDDAAARERFIIGTFVSLSWAALCAVLANLV